MKKSLERAKGFVIGVLVTVMLLSAGTALAAVTRNITVSYLGVRLVVNGQEVTPRDAQGNVVEPFIFEGSTFLPVRAVAEALGYSVNWDAATHTAYIGGEAPPPPPPTTITLGVGQYVVGVDIPAGTYNVRAVSGMGNFMGDVASQPFGMLNAILEAPGAGLGLMESTLDGLRLADGDEFNIMGSLRLEFTRR